MSTWISRAAAAVLLAGCVATEPVSFAGGEIRAAAPAGYCVDRRASHDDGAGAVVLMGRCSDGSAAAPALIAVSIGGPGSSAVLQTGAQALSDYFRSAPGRAALARDGRAGSVKVRQTSLSQGVLVLHVADRAVGDYWRAILGLKGRLVTISVTGPENGTLDSAGGRAILERTIAAMRRANAGTPP